MNFIDIIILLILLFEAWRGFTHGLIVEVFTLLALLLGVFVAMRYAYVLEEPLLSISSSMAPYVRYVALGVTFLLVVIAMKIIGYLLTKVAEAVALGVVNKLLGVIFAVLKAVVVVSILLLLADALDDRYVLISPQVKSGSLFYYPLLEMAEDAYDMVRTGAAL